MGSCIKWDVEEAEEEMVGDSEVPVVDLSVEACKLFSSCMSTSATDVIIGIFPSSWLKREDISETSAVFFN